MVWISRKAESILIGLAYIGVAAVAMMLVHIIADVIARSVFNVALPATGDIVARYYMVAAAFFPLALVEKRGGMISVEIIESVMSPLAIKLSDVIVYFVCSAIYSIMSYSSLLLAMSHYRSGAFIMSLSVYIPTWPSYFILPIALGFAAAVTAVKAVATIVSIVAPQSR